MAICPGRLHASIHQPRTFDAGEGGCRACIHQLSAGLWIAFYKLRYDLMGNRVFGGSMNDRWFAPQSFRI
jgi:hypothetical protein